MKKTQISATRHLLNFKDISDEDFERLCYWLVEDSKDFDIVEHYGMTGDKKRDVVGYKHKGNNKVEKWYFQCKNYQKISFSVVRDELNSIKQHIDANPEFKPYAIVFVIGCMTTPDCNDETKKYGKSIGLSHIYFWTRLTLDQKVKKNPRILEEFFEGGMNVGRTIREIIKGVMDETPQYINSVSPLTNSKKFSADINSQISDSNAFISERDFEKAKSSLFKLLGKLEDNPSQFRSELTRIHNNIGVCFARSELEGGNLDKADFHFNLALSISPTFEKASVNLIFVNILRRNEENYEKAFELAKPLWDNSRKEEPSILLAYLLAIFHYKSASDAIEMYNNDEKVKILSENNLELLKFLAFLHLNNREFDAAEHWVEVALELSPNHPESLSLKAKIILSRLFTEKISYKNFEFLPVVKDIQDIAQARFLLTTALTEANFQKKIDLAKEIKFDLLVCCLHLKTDFEKEYTNIRNTIIPATLNCSELKIVEFLDIVFEFERRNFPNAYHKLIHSSYWDTLEYFGKKQYALIFYLRGAPEQSKEILNVIRPVADEKKDIQFWLDFSIVEALLNHKNLVIQALTKAKAFAKDTKMEKEVSKRDIRIMKRYAPTGDTTRWIKGLLEYNSKYPEEKLLTKIVEKDKENPIKMMTFLKKSQKRWAKQKNIIKSNIFPSYLLEKTFSKPYAQILSDQNDPDFTIPLMIADVNFAKELKISFENADAIIFDYASLLNFSKMNLLADLENFDKTMLISKDLFQKIQEELIDYENEDLRNLWETIRVSKKFHILECDEKLTSSPDLSKYFDPWLINSIIITKQKNAVFVIDDLYLLKMLIAEKIPSCNSIVVLKIMLEKNLIDEEIYASSLGDLAERLYTVLDFSGEDLCKIVIEDNGKISLRTYHLVSQIKNPELKRFPISWQLFVFIKYFWRLGFLFEDKLMWLKLISSIFLDSIRDSMKKVNGEFESHLVRFDLNSIWSTAIRNSDKDEQKILEIEYQKFSNDLDAIFLTNGYCY